MRERKCRSSISRAVQFSAQDIWGRQCAIAIVNLDLQHSSLRPFVPKMSFILRKIEVFGCQVWFSHIPHRLLDGQRTFEALKIYPMCDCLGSEKAITCYLSTISMVAGMAKKRGQIKSTKMCLFTPPKGFLTLLSHYYSTTGCQIITIYKSAVFPNFGI